MKNPLKSLPLLTVALVLGACGQGNVPRASTPTAEIVTLPSAARENPLASAKWFVELEGDPTALGAQSIGAQQSSFRLQAQRQGIKYQEVASYDTLFNGFSVVATGSEINRISQMPGVLGVYLINKVQVSDPAPTPVEPQMFYAKAMTGADIAQNELGLTGKGVKVGVIDSGVDVDHPAFKGRIVAGWDFVGDDYGKDGKYEAKPDDNPDDCGGHGTHVAGIIGGNVAENGFKGVAPEVSFGAYRIFGCDGSSYDDVILAAMERAQKDGMQVVNMSLGSAFQNWRETPLAKAADRMVKKGVIMVASGGNSGANGQYSMGGPTMGDNVISVAAVDNVKFDLEGFTLSDGAKTKIAFYAATGSPAPKTGTTLAITKRPGSTTTTANDGCDPYAENSLAGQAVLIRRGTCSFYIKAMNAQKAGAAAVILYNNAAGYINPTVAPPTPADAAITIPVVSVSDTDGAKIDALIASGIDLTFDGSKVAVVNPTGNTISGFSSLGMSAELEFKPDIAAPGGSIYSTYPLEEGGYAVLSGTSMAAPHVAGVAALLLQAYPNIEAKEMRTRLMNTASLRWFFNNGKPLEGVPDYVQRQGAGMVDVVNAYSNTVRATPSKLSLGASTTFATRNKVVVLKNTGSKREVYHVYHAPALTVSGTSFAPTPSTKTAAMSINGVNVDSEALEVVVPPFGEVELNVTITPPAEATDKSQYGGYIYMENPAGSNLVVPYGGFKGDYQSLTSFGSLVIGGKRYAAPLLADDVAGGLYPKGAELTELPDYTFKDVEVEGEDEPVMDAPYLVVNVAHQIRRLTFELLDENGAVVDTLGKYDYLGRSCTDNLANHTATCRAYSTFSWDGKLSNGTAAPAGVYQLRLKALKPLGDETNAAHTEIYTSQKFKVVR